MNEPTISTNAINAFLDAAADLGVGRSKLLGKTRLSDLQLESANERVPLSAAVTIDLELERHLGSEAAFKIGSATADRGALLVDYICNGSGTLREFLQRLSRFHPLNINWARPNSEIRGDHVWFGTVYSEKLVQQYAPIIERVLAHWSYAIRKAVSGDWTPGQIYLQTKQREQRNTEALLHAPVVHDASGSWLVFPSAMLDAPIAGSDPALLSHLLPTAEARLAALNARDGFASIVRDVMGRLFALGSFNIEDIARQLAVSPRTLQRRLGNEGTSFGELFDEARRSAAIAFLKNPHMPIKETAFRVGFSEPSTFHRAFRRWTGATPSSYRRSLAI